MAPFYSVQTKAFANEDHHPHEGPRQRHVRDPFDFVDGRYSFIHTRFAGAGGNARQRNAARHEQEIKYLKRKWGQYLDVVQAKGTTRICVRVVR